MRLVRYAADKSRTTVVRVGPLGKRPYTIIYAIDCPKLGCIKFGRTLNVEKRFRAIGAVIPSDVTLLGYVWMPDEAEAHIFDFLDADRFHGEWFIRTERVRSIAALIAAKRAEQLAQHIGLGWMLLETLWKNETLEQAAADCKSAA